MNSAFKGWNNDKFYAQNTLRLKMNRAMDEYHRLGMRLRQMESLGMDELLSLPPSELTDTDKARLEEYKALKEEMEALYCMGTTGSYPPGYVPKQEQDPRCWTF